MVIKKKRGSEEAKNISKKLLSAVMAAVLVSLVLIAFAPLAAAGISSFTITSDTGVAGEVSAYEAVLNTTAEFTTLNATIAAKFGLEEPTDSELIARVGLQNNTIQNYGYITFTANGSNPANRLDVFANIGGDTAEATVDVDYSAEGTTTAGSPFGGASYVKVTLPTDSADGSLELSLPMGMRNISVDVREFMKNPTTCGDYLFNITVDDIHFDSDTVRITEIEAINVISPEARAYASTCVRLNFTIEPEGGTLAWIGYSLDGGANVTIAGNTTVQNVGSLVGSPPYNHNIVVYANDTCGNMVASNTVYFTMHPGDITGDCKVDGFDLQRFAWAFLSKLGDPNWNEDADIRNCDNKVDGFDLQILAWNFLKQYPCPP
ncbi:MAG: hypothetical protein CHKLHMKO_00132 [Candidatus Argoarchaeum ethanivorans]|uniref:Dockerin domain-containing protein n=1 Tax=Candidatus Argoarchaeum ethanivorans TaxID=2608793 RepID=A0A811T579_9EURY|nr:MAG: hypothetical protein CHKLHMKO_00132 [Candidatus Argoarchaeum ethanivorans]